MSRKQSDKQALLSRHVRKLYSCRACLQMQSTPVSGRAVVSKVMLVGQAPGEKEPVLHRPFAWTAGKALFKWFEQESGVNEAEFRQTVYLAAVCRCFPGKTSAGGDRVPNKAEISCCSRWMQMELSILEPDLVIPVGKLAISQFVPGVASLTEVVGQTIRATKFGHAFDLVPLPHPSGASPWHRTEPGKSLTKKALELISNHPAWAQLKAVAK